LGDEAEIILKRGAKIEMRHIKFWLLMIFLLTSFIPVCFAEEKSDYKVIILTEKPTVDPGETITFDIYIVGNGNVETNKIIIYTDSAFRIVEINFTDERMNKESDMQKQLRQEGTTIFAGNLPSGVFNSVSSTPEFSPIMTELKPIFKITGNIPDNISTGEHELSIAFTYSDGVQWNVYTTNSKFHVRNLLERHEKIAFSAIVTAIIVGFINIIIFFYENIKKLKKDS
jgi:hypothetical protein